MFEGPGWFHLRQSAPTDVHGAMTNMPLLAWIWKSQMDVSMAMRSGLPVASNLSTASLDSATRRPGPISL